MEETTKAIVYSITTIVIILSFVIILTNTAEKKYEQKIQICENLPDCFKQKCEYEQTQSQKHYQEYMICAIESTVKHLNYIGGKND